MRKKAGKSTESKKLKDAVSANKTRIKKKPLAGVRDWAGEKMQSSKSWVRGTSTKARVAFLCLGVIGLSAGALPFVDLKGPMASLNSQLTTENQSDKQPEVKAEMKHAKGQSENSAVKARAIETEPKSTTRLSADKPNNSFTKKATVKSKKAKSKSALHAKKAKIEKSKLAKHKTLKGKRSLAAKDK